MASTNQTFSPRRFGSYFAKYVADNRARLLLSCTIVVGVPILFSLGLPYVSDYYSTEEDPMWSRELTFFNFLYLWLSIYFGSVFYGQLASKGGRIALFTTPASNLEKFFTSFVVYVVAFNLLFIGASFFADWLRVAVYSGGAPEGSVCAPIPLKFVLSCGFYDSPVYNSLPNDVSTFMGAVAFSGVVAGGVLGQAVYALGCTLWPKNSLLKTLAATIGLTVVCVMLANWGFDVMYGYFPEMDGRLILGVDKWHSLIFWDAVLGLVAAFVWWLGYARMKEWEIVKRW